MSESDRTRCRCAVLNVMSGEVAHEYLRYHLQVERTDGMGRTVHACPDSDIHWIEERRASGYGGDVIVLRRAQR
jgi:hypothetical protein